MDMYNRMSPEMLEGYQRYAQTLLNAGFFNTAYSDGKPDLALFNSSIAGVTAASIGGTYTLKLDEEWVYEDKNGEELEKPFPRWVVNKELVPGGPPNPGGIPSGEEGLDRGSGIGAAREALKSDKCKDFIKGQFGEDPLGLFNKLAEKDQFVPGQSCPI
jgi:hypothetical protein